MKISHSNIQHCLLMLLMLFLVSCRNNNTLKFPAADKASDRVESIIENSSNEESKPKSLAKAFSQAIDSIGIDRGVVFYNSMKESNDYYIDNDEMNMVSHELQQSERSIEALEVLKLGIEAFPFAFNLYDSYGEVLNSVGRTEESIVQYTKSVTLNPQNENGIKMLSKLGVEIDPKELYLLKSDSLWRVERFTFPISFARDIIYNGTEEAYFPRGWRDTTSIEFWSYAFTWRIDINHELSEDELERELYKYFHGLLTIVNKQKDLVIQETLAALKKDENGQFTGTVKMHDSFTTERELIVNVTAKQHICPTTKMSIVVLRFSPKPYESQIWDKLNELSLRDNYCKL